MSKTGWVRSLDTRRITLISAALIIVLAGVGAALAAVLLPPRVAYETRLVVGTSELSAQQVPYYSTATVSLAETYARYITEVDGAGHAAELSASVIAETPVLRIEAVAPRAEDAKAAAEQAAANLMTKVNEGRSADFARLSDAVAQASNDLAELQGAEARLPENASASERARVAADIRLAELRLTAASDVYRNAQVADLNPTLQLSVIQEAFPVTETLPRPLLVGALAGGALGGLLCLVLFTLQAKRPSEE